MIAWPPDITFAFRLYSRRRRQRLAGQDALGEQRRQLARLVAAAAPTRFGRDHGFAEVRTPADFQARVPLRRYEDLWCDYLQPAFPVYQDLTWPGRIPYLALTSGTTTGATKYIPVSRQMVRSNRMAALDIMVHHLAHHPRSRVMAGPVFLLGGSTAMETMAPGVEAGDLSGIAAREVSLWARPWTFPRADLALIADWDAKITKLAEAARRLPVHAVSGVPSWLLVLFDRLAELAGPDAPPLPQLELLIHGGVAWGPYRDRFAPLLARTGAVTREVYPASEGFFAVADAGDGEGLRLIVDNGIFFEFVPVDELGADSPTRHTLAEAQPGVNYAIAVSTNAGMWGHVVGDTVRFVSMDPPRVLITGRTSYMLSAFGEHLIGEEVEAAVAAAAHRAGIAVTEFSVGPVHAATAGEIGHHLYVLEPGTAPGDPGGLADRLAAAIDADLKARNADYAAHRTEGVGIGAPVVQIAPQGTFRAWMRLRGKLGGQNKVPRVITAPDLFASLRAAATGGGD